MSETLFERMSDAQRAHARRTDPQTSHLAAEAVTDNLTELQMAVEMVTKRFPDGFTDVDLLAVRPDLKPSTLRTRRSELVARNVVLDSMRRVRPDGETQLHTVWIHRMFVENPPPLVDAAPPKSKADDRAEAEAIAKDVEDGAKQMRREGRSLFADRLDEAAAMLRKLSA